MKLDGAYAYFCDDNGLARVNVEPKEVLRNLDAMATALLGMRAAKLRDIAERCPHCGSPRPAKSFSREEKVT